MSETETRTAPAPDQKEAIRAACHILGISEEEFIRQAIFEKLATVPICRWDLTSGEVSFLNGFREIQTILREASRLGVDGQV
jgi:hypothetical protein